MKEREQTLLDLYRGLNDQDAQTLLRFAEFLASSDSPIEIVSPTEVTADQPAETEQTVQKPDIPQPVMIEKPTEEKVVDALKRMSATYPMLEKKQLLDKASALVAQHVMFGQPAELVITQIEDMFAKEYEKFVEEFNS